MTMTKNQNAIALLHPTVLRAIRGMLRKFGMRPQDLDEGVAEVQTRTLECLRDKPQPEALEEWAALCATVAKHWRLDENEKFKARKKYDVGLCEDADEHVGFEKAVEARDIVDAGRLVGVLREQFEAGEMPEKGEEILDCVQAGLDYQEIALELGISPEAVRKRLKRMRDLYDARLETLGRTSERRKSAAQRPGSRAHRSEEPDRDPEAG